MSALVVLYTLLVALSTACGVLFALAGIHESSPEHQGDSAAGVLVCAVVTAAATLAVISSDWSAG